MTEAEVYEAAYWLVVSGAESHAEDWIDEDGQYSEGDGEQVFEAQMHLVEMLRSPTVRQIVMELALPEVT